MNSISAITPIYLALSLSAADLSFELGRDMARKPLPTFNNGNLCGIELDQPRVYAMGADGVSRFDRDLSLADASSIGLTYCAPSPKGNFAVIGGAQDRSGRLIAFIAHMDKVGVIKSVDQFDEFAPALAHFDSTGNLWVVGARPGLLRVKGEADDVTVRKYSANGALLLSLSLPYSEHWRRPLAGHAFVSSSGTGLTLLVSNRDELVFVSDDGKIVRQPYQSVAGQQFVVGFAVTPSGRAYMTAQTQIGKTSKVVQAEWNGTMWKEVPGLDGMGPGAIVGTINEKLVSIEGTQVTSWPAATAR